MADAKLTALTETSVPALDDLGYSVDVSDTTDDAAGSSRKLTFSRLLGLAGVAPGGRLTTETGVPVSTSDRTSQSTLYYTPYLHDHVRLSDGTRIKEYLFTERSLALSGLTSGKNYDVFLYDSSGTLTLELLAWTNDTTRATALAWQSGLGWVKDGAATRLYLGTVRTTGTTTVEDSAAKRFVWNAHNRVGRPLLRHDSTDSWTYNSETWRQARGSSANQVEAVVGLSGVPVRLFATALAGTTATVGIRVAVGADSTSSPAAASVYSGEVPVSTFANPVSSYQDAVALGYHYWAWLESAHADGTNTFYGDAGGALERAGLVGGIEA